MRNGPVGLVMVLLVACGVLPGSALADSAVASGASLFSEKCGMCHRKSGMGTVLLSRRMDAKVAELEKRDDLTIAWVARVVRTGVGNMPRIARGEVSDSQLGAIASYLAKGKPGE